MATDILYRAGLRLTHAGEGKRWIRRGKTPDGRHYQIESDGEIYLAEIRYVDNHLTEYIPLFTTRYDLRLKNGRIQNRGNLVKAWDTMNGVTTFAYDQIKDLVNKRVVATAIKNGYMEKVSKKNEPLDNDTQLRFSPSFVKILPSYSGGI